MRKKFLLGFLGALWGFLPVIGVLMKVTSGENYFDMWFHQGISFFQNMELPQAVKLILMVVSTPVWILIILPIGYWELFLKAVVLPGLKPVMGTYPIITYALFCTLPLTTLGYFIGRQLDRKSQRKEMGFYID